MRHGKTPTGLSEIERHTHTSHIPQAYASAIVCHRGVCGAYARRMRAILRATRSGYCPDTKRCVANERCATPYGAYAYARRMRHAPTGRMRMCVCVCLRASVLPTGLHTQTNNDYVVFIRGTMGQQRRRHTRYVCACLCATGLSDEVCWQSMMTTTKMTTRMANGAHKNDADLSLLRSLACACVPYGAARTGVR